MLGQQVVNGFGNTQGGTAAAAKRQGSATKRRPTGNGGPVTAAVNYGRNTQGGWAKG